MEPRIVEGTVSDQHSSFLYSVVTEDHQILKAHLSALVKRQRFATGDRVKIELSPYDSDRCRIIGKLSN